MTRQITLAQTKEFIFGGKAFLTLKNATTEVRKTFKIKRSKRPATPHLFYISLLTGSDNNGDYTFLGTINQETMQYFHGKDSRILAGSDATKGVMYLLHCLQRNNIAPNMEIWHEGKCCRCGRLLTTPESIESGIGPECAKRMNR